MSDIWSSIPSVAQDTLIFSGLVLPALLLSILLLRDHKPLPLAVALIRSNAWTSLGFAVLIAISVAIGVGLIAQERSFRAGTAQAAEKFDLIIGAPGSETSLLFSTVFLQPNPLELLDGETFNDIAAHERLEFAAPIGLGDSFEGATIVGTTADLVEHLGGIAEGRIWNAPFDAIAGVDAPIGMGGRFEPAHGHGADADEDAHSGLFYEVVGVMARTHSPWDQAIIIPIETVWSTHGLANGHAPERADQLGPPFDAEYFPGTSAVIVIADSFSGTFQIHSDFTSDTRTMAIFPGAVLGYLYRVIGDARLVATVIIWISLGLVSLAVLGGLTILSRLFSRHMAVLRAIGAPLRFVSATIWSFSVMILLAGVIIGVLGAFGMVSIIGSLLSAQSGINLTAQIGWEEIHLLAGFVSLTLIAAALIARRLAKAADPITLRN